MPAELLDDALLIALHVPLRVLITGETPEQREHYAKLIHSNSQARGGPFVIYRQAARANDDDGRWIERQFDGARGGTLFINDVAALTTAAQRQLYRSLEEALSSRPDRSEAGPAIRVIAGASRHLDVERATGAFFEPLFYRLNVIHIDLTAGSSP